jgi:hypothetical protein
MQIERYTAVDENTIRVEYLKQVQMPPRRSLVFTFTERGNASLSGNGFGGDYLLASGCDVMAIKGTSCRWFEELTPTVIERILATLKDYGRDYTLRACYGSSMGGYAAMRYAHALKVDRTLAISPLFRIGAEEDKRYCEDISKMVDPGMMRAEHVNSCCHYCIIFDPFSPDSWHAQRYAEIVAPGNFTALKVPYSGHPSGCALAETGVLKQVVTAMLLDGKCPQLRTLPYCRQRSPTYLYWLGAALVRHRKFVTAARCLEKAVLLSPNNCEIFSQLARAYSCAGDAARARNAAHRAIDADPYNVHRRIVLLDVLEQEGSKREALALVHGILRDTPEQPGSLAVQFYTHRRSSLQAKLANESAANLQ